jgi:hypothetical protein
MVARAIVAVILAVACARSGYALDVTECNTLVPDGEVAILQADLNCAGAFIAVGLGENATLDLNGHSITGTFYPDPPRAVECRGVRCTILSSNGIGRIGGGDFIALRIGSFTDSVAKLRISDVELYDARAGIFGSNVIGEPRKTKAHVERVVSHGHAEFGIWVAKLIARDVDTSDNGTVGVATDKLKGYNLTTNNNGAAGIYGTRVSVKGLVANGNGDGGVRAIRATLRDATLTGNTPYDLITKRRPRVRNTICGTSQVLGGVGGQTWGVCSED